MQIADARIWGCGEADTWSLPVPPFALPAAGAHVWLCPLAAGDAGLCSDAERARAENMLPAGKAPEFLRARAWLRKLIALYLPETEPGSIRLGIAETGKPYLVDFPGVYFNISHSYEYVAIALGRSAVGIDIEKLRPIPDWKILAANLFAYKTVKSIARFPAAEQGREFLRQFTAREACLKALGLGFSAASGALTGDTNEPKALPDMPRGYVGSICILPASTG